jgi:UDP-N-acetylglucosamine diphosphorylase/glucosamine-1-phosphate N-acetyltransferase
MRLCVFEDAGVTSLEPLALTRPAWSLWCGAASLLERQVRALAADEVGALVRPELLEVCRRQYPRLPLNETDFLRGDDLVLTNARWLPPAHFALDMSRPHVGLVNGQTAYVVRPDALADLRPEAAQAWLARCRLPAQEAGGAMIDFLWDLVDHNPEALVQDQDWFGREPGYQARPPHVAVQGPADRLVVAEDAVLEPFVFADTRQGPVLIEHGAVVHSFSRLEGPCYVGKESWIMGAKLRGGTVGPHCRIGGEVEASIVHGHSNKYHDGFLGHSYVGEWVNLAAGTQTSDLRNDYGQVKVTVAGQRVATGRTKVGSFIGDHSKTGLGALLNTGSVIGAFCNVLAAGFLLPQVVPSFCQVNHGQVQERLDMRQLFTTAATVMRRRGETLTDAHQDFFYWLYDATAELRHRTIREAEKRILRRSV